MYERQLLRELEALAPDVAAAANKVQPPPPNGVPRPTVILPLEEYSKPRPSTPSTPPATAAVTGTMTRAGTVPPAVATAHKQPLSASAILPPSSTAPFRPHTQSHSPPPMLSHSASASPATNPRTQFSPLSPPPSAPAQDPLSAAITPYSAVFPRQPLAQSPSAGPSTLSPTPTPTPTFSQSQTYTHTQYRPTHTPEPPLGGRYLDGSKSMFISPPALGHARAAHTYSQSHSPSPSTPSPSAPAFPSVAGAVRARAGSLGRASGAVVTGVNPLAPSAGPGVYPGSGSGAGGGAGASASANGHGREDVDPLGQVAVRPMTLSLTTSSSVMLGKAGTVGRTPVRARLDAREAASKLASMF
jgi:hypothetical protein